MIRLLRSFLPYLLIALFLTPQVTVAVHNFQHSHDFHCNDANSHFHVQEHHCSICDFTVPLTNASILYHYSPEAVYYLSTVLPWSDESILVSSSHSYFSLRAPPVIA